MDANARAVDRFVFALRWDPAPAPFGLKALRHDVDLDAACALLSFQGALIDSVHGRQLTSHGGALVHHGNDRDGAGAGDDEAITVLPGRFGSHVAAAMFTVIRADRGPKPRVPGAEARLHDMRFGDMVVRVELADLAPATGALVAGIVRTADGWRPRAYDAVAKARSHHDLATAMRGALQRG